MSTIRSQMQRYVEDPPDDLVGFYESGQLPCEPSLFIRVLDFAEALERTQKLHEYVILGEPLGLWELDDANDSNPYCYITRGLARGCILHLRHDGDTVVEYASLGAFIAAIQIAIAGRLRIEDLPNKDLHPQVNQNDLSERIRHLAAEDTVDGECELTVLIPLLDVSKRELISELAVHGNFYIREAVAELICSKPMWELRDR